jgi:1-acyl-sn-glycerol-3-phosphate acyltransferase
MVSKTGVARLALATDAPVVPIAHWGAHRLLGYRSKRPNLFPRKLVTALAGPPIDLSAYREKYGPGKEDATNDVLREVTDLLMTRVKELLAEIRGETPPAGFFQPTNPSGAGVSDSAAKQTGVA